MKLIVAPLLLWLPLSISAIKEQIAPEVKSNRNYTEFLQILDKKYDKDSQKQMKHEWKKYWSTEAIEHRLILDDKLNRASDIKKAKNELHLAREKLKSSRAQDKLEEHKEKDAIHALKSAERKIRFEGHDEKTRANIIRKETNIQAKNDRMFKSLRSKFGKQLYREAGSAGVVPYTACVPDRSLVGWTAESDRNYDGISTVTSEGVMNVKYDEKCQGLWYVMIKTMEKLTLETDASLGEVNDVKRIGSEQKWYRYRPYNKLWGVQNTAIPITFTSKSNPENFKYYYCCQGADELDSWFESQTLLQQAEDCFPANGDFAEWQVNHYANTAFTSKRKRRDEDTSVYGTMTVSPSDWSVVDNAYFIVKGAPFDEVKGLWARVDFGGKYGDCTIESLGNDTWKVNFPKGMMKKMQGNSVFNIAVKIDGAGSNGNYLSWFWCEK